MESETAFADASTLWKKRQTYIVRKNGDVVGYTDDEKIGIWAANQLASSELTEGMSGRIRFRQNFNEGREIHICHRTQGRLWDGKLRKDIVIDVVPIDPL
jgi:hypothetical protein